MVYGIYGMEYGIIFFPKFSSLVCASEMNKQRDMTRQQKGLKRTYRKNTLKRRGRSFIRS